MDPSRDEANQHRARSPPGGWWDYFEAECLWLPVHALAHVDATCHDTRGKVIRADAYRCPVCQLKYKSLDALRTHLGVMELSAIKKASRGVSSQKRSPHCIPDVAAFARQHGIQDEDLVQVLWFAEKFPLDMFLDFNGYTRSHEHWRMTVKKALLGAMGEKLSFDHASALVRSCSLPCSASLPDLVVDWHFLLQGTTREGVSSAVDVMISSKAAGGGYTSCTVVESKVQGRVNKWAWYKSIFTNVAGTILTTGRIDAYHAMHTRDKPFSTVMSALIDGYENHPMYLGCHHDGGEKWNVVQLAGGRVIHASFSPLDDRTCSVHVKLGFPAASNPLALDSVEHDGSFTFLDEDLPCDYSQLERRADAMITRLASSSSSIASQELGQGHDPQ